MVTFVCSNCNLSLKKSQVPIHRCNGTFACITCNCDFNKATFKTHDRCITEAEKYQGSDFKQKVNKGEAKQESWSNTVIEALDNYKPIDGRLNSIINHMRSRSNIPQKEKKFMNFLSGIPGSKQVSNCHEIIWGVISKHSDKMKSSTQIVSVVVNDKDETKLVTNGDIVEIADGEASNTDAKLSQKKSKKRKHDEVAADEGKESKRKKIKETEKTTEKEVVDIQEIIDVTTEIKKKKKKSQKGEAMEEKEPITESSKKKKKRFNNEELQGEIAGDETLKCKPAELEEPTTETTKKTKKKKKSKREDIQEEIAVSEKKKKKKSSKRKSE